MTSMRQLEMGNETEIKKLGGRAVDEQPLQVCDFGKLWRQPMSFKEAATVHGKVLPTQSALLTRYHE